MWKNVQSHEQRRTRSRLRFAGAEQSQPANAKRGGVPSLAPPEPGLEMSILKVSALVRCQMDEPTKELTKPSRMPLNSSLLCTPFSDARVGSRYLSSAPADSNFSIKCSYLRKKTKSYSYNIGHVVRRWINLRSNPKSRLIRSQDPWSRVKGVDPPPIKTLLMLNFVLGAQFVRFQVLFYFKEVL